MKKYDSYKDSGIEWIGELPSHWKNTRIKFTVNEKNSLFIDGDWIESKVITEEGIRYITTGNVKVGYYSEQGNGYISNQTFIDLNCTEVFEGDLILSRLNNPIGRACIVPNLNSRIVTSVDNVIYRPDSNLNKRYLLYLFSSKEYFEHTELISRGATMQRISRGMLGNLKIPLPEIEEQTTIANYLDQKTSQIDDLIAKKERLIQLLEEERTAIINQAVTKGLDPTVPMKDSGIEWLGEIPAHWEVKQVRYLLLTGNEGIKIGPFGSALKLEFMVSEGYKIYGQENVIKDDFSLGYKFINEEKYQELLNYKISSGDIVITMMGTAGLAKVVPKNIQEGIMDSHLTRIRVDEEKLLNRLFELLLNDSYLIKSQVQFHSKGAIMGGLNSTIIKSFVLPVAPIDEQEEILSFIESKLNSLIKANMHIKREIELLREYKTALISEVVTGKVDVRNEKLN